MLPSLPPVSLQQSSEEMVTYPLVKHLVSLIVSVFHVASVAGISVYLAGGVRTDLGFNGNRLRVCRGGRVFMA